MPTVDDSRVTDVDGVSRKNVFQPNKKGTLSLLDSLNVIA